MHKLSNTKKNENNHENENHQTRVNREKSQRKN